MTDNRPFAPSWERTRRGITGVFLVAMVAGLTPAFPPSAAAQVAEPTPLDLVVAVDESGSLATQDVRGEIEAAATIAQSGLNPRTRVTVLGFGSATGTGRRAVTQYCRPTVVGTAEQLQYLSNCVKRLHRRTAAEGNDTDHAAAISAAVRTLGSGSPPNALKSVFLLTDGRMDVSNSPSYGSGDRNAAAERRLRRELQTARREGIQIWPLGFGPQVDQAGLNGFAAGGAQRGCDNRPESRPRARRVQDSRQVARSLVEAYAAASCFRVSPPSEGELRPGAPLDLPLAVPDIASEATLTVAKGDPRVQVEFIDPNGRPAPSNGSQGPSTFTRSGTDGTIEALRVIQPLNGTWRIRLTAPPGVAGQPVSATAMYQGVIRSALVAEPRTVRTGDPVTVRISLVTRRGHVQNPGDLVGLHFTVTATGQALGAGRTVQINVNDLGRAPDDVPNDGSHAGVFTAPGTPGTITLTGAVTGMGLRSDGNPSAAINVIARPPDVSGVVKFPDGTTTHPGGVVNGTVQLHNSTSRTVRARLALNAPPQADATLTPGTALTVPPGDSPQPFTVRFGRAAVLGRDSVTIQLIDETDQAKVYLTKQQAITVEKPPGWLERHFWQILGGIALVALALAAAWLVRRAARARRDVRGLLIGLRHNGEQAGRELAPQRGRWSDEFPFVIRDAGGPSPLLDHPRPGEEAMVARRAEDGQITVRRPDGTTFQAGLGAETETVADGLRLVFRRASSRFALGGLLDGLLDGLLGRLIRGGRPPAPPRRSRAPVPRRSEPVPRSAEPVPQSREPVPGSTGPPDTVQSDSSADEWL